METRRIERSDEPRPDMVKLVNFLNAMEAAGLLPANACFTDSAAILRQVAEAETRGIVISTSPNTTIETRALAAKVKPLNLKVPFKPRAKATAFDLETELLWLKHRLHKASNN